jgi:hypothetical protein
LIAGRPEKPHTEELMTQVTTTKTPTTDGPRTGARVFIASALMLVTRVLPVLLAVLFGLADTALFIWLIVKGQWGWVILTVILAAPIIQVAGWIAAGLVMPFYGLARLFDRETTELIIERWD